MFLPSRDRRRDFQQVSPICRCSLLEGPHLLHVRLAVKNSTAHSGASCESSRLVTFFCLVSRSLARFRALFTHPAVCRGLSTSTKKKPPSQHRCEVLSLSHTGQRQSLVEVMMDKNMSNGSTSLMTSAAQAESTATPCILWCSKSSEKRRDTCTQWSMLRTWHPCSAQIRQSRGEHRDQHILSTIACGGNERLGRRKKKKHTHRARKENTDDQAQPMFSRVANTSDQARPTLKDGQMRKQQQWSCRETIR